MTVFENVAFAMRVTGASNRDVRKGFPIFLIGRLAEQGEVIQELSGGEQQRVSLARRW